MSAIERAQADLANGEPWLARDRLRSVVASAPLNIEALELLGDVYWLMNDKRSAGGAWVLTNRDDERATEAIGILSRMAPQQLRHAVPMKHDLFLYPPLAQHRLIDLIQQSSSSNWMSRKQESETFRPEPEYGLNPFGRFVMPLVWIGVIAFFLTAPWSNSEASYPFIMDLLAGTMAISALIAIPCHFANMRVALFFSSVAVGTGLPLGLYDWWRFEPSEGPLVYVGPDEVIAIVIAGLCLALSTWPRGKRKH